MSEAAHGAGGTGPSHRGVELGVAAFMAALALIGIYGSVDAGIGWGRDGPRAGFFPFYVSLIVLITCVINAVFVLTTSDQGRFAQWSELWRVVSVLVPTTIFVGMIPYIGIYVSSALLIAVFMRWFGQYNWLVSVSVAVAVSILTLLMFEIWFLVPLPKGPIEAYFGY